MKRFSKSIMLSLSVLSCLSLTTLFSCSRNRTALTSSNGNLINERLRSLREVMKMEKIDVYLLPGTDPHRNEQSPDHWDRKAFLPGFTGAYGNVAITMNKAMLWTDGRDEIQAKQQLKGTSFDYDVKGQTTNDISIEMDWIIDQLLDKKGGIVGVDPQLINMNQANSLKKILKKYPQVSLRYMENNLVDRIWAKQPALPSSKVYFRDERYENVSAIQKIKHLQGILKEKKEDSDDKSGKKSGQAGT